jgi:hypothetical protein
MGSGKRVEMAWCAALDSAHGQRHVVMSDVMLVLTQHKTQVALETGEDLGLLDRPGADVGHGLVADGGLLGRARHGPARLGDLRLEELLNKRRLEVRGLCVSGARQWNQRSTQVRHSERLNRDRPHIIVLPCARTRPGLTVKATSEATAEAASMRAPVPAAETTFWARIGKERGVW